MSVATVYAKALYEAHEVQGPARAEIIESELAAVQKLIEQSKELRMTLLSPLVNPKERAAVIQDLGKKAGLSAETSQFLALMARKNRLSVLGAVVSEYASIRVQAQGGVVGNLITAEPIADEDVESLAAAFAKKLGKKIKFRVSTDPSLLAGVQVNVNGVTYDGTLRAQLRRLRDDVLSAGRTA